MVEKLGITPGPWKVIEDEDGFGISPGILQVSFDDFGSAWPIVEKREDADLISAAPEMLEMLIDVYDGFYIANAHGSKKMQRLIEKAAGIKWSEIIKLLEVERG